MPKLKPGTILPTPEEDRKITRAALSDPDAQPLSDDQSKRMRPASEVLPELLGKDRAAAMVKKRGRPMGSGSKEQITLRIDADVIDAFKRSGDGWQTRMNDALKDWLRTHSVG